MISVILPTSMFFLLGVKDNVPQIIKCPLSSWKLYHTKTVEGELLLPWIIFMCWHIVRELPPPRGPQDINIKSVSTHQQAAQLLCQLLEKSFSKHNSWRTAAHLSISLLTGFTGQLPGPCVWFTEKFVQPDLKEILAFLSRQSTDLKSRSVTLPINFSSTVLFPYSYSRFQSKVCFYLSEKSPSPVQIHQ